MSVGLGSRTNLLTRLIVGRTVSVTLPSSCTCGVRLTTTPTATVFGVVVTDWRLPLSDCPLADLGLDREVDDVVHDFEQGGLIVQRHQLGAGQHARVAELLEQADGDVEVGAVMPP